MPKPPGRVALLTDFGTQDTYVGVMKGVIAGIAPLAEVIDINHNVPPGDIQRAAFQLWQALPYFPQGTVFVVVVDPGVGSARRAVAAAFEEMVVVAPDNGVLSYLLANSEPDGAVQLDNPRYHLDSVSTTFHGRDVFAPAGAYLALGTDLQELGTAATDLSRFALPQLEWEGPARLGGEILHFDHFGNAITSLGRLTPSAGGWQLQPWLPSAAPGLLGSPLQLTLDSGLEFELGATFSDVAEGRPIAYIGSESMVEIAVNRGHAAKQLKLARGQAVHLTSKG